MMAGGGAVATLTVKVVDEVFIPPLLSVAVTTMECCPPAVVGKLRVVVPVAVSVPMPERLKVMGVPSSVAISDSMGKFEEEPSTFTTTEAVCPAQSKML